jgi:hypothetical protein
MKRLILIAGIVVCFGKSIKAQSFPCDISSGGIELRDATGTANATAVALNGYATAYTNMINIGVGMPLPAGGVCGYAPGQVEVRAQFVPPYFSSCYFIYPDPTFTFTTAKYSWSYNSTLHQLVGINTAVVTSDFAGIDDVLIPIKGIKLGTANLQIVVSAVGAISDDVSNNTKNLPVNVVSVLPVTLNDVDGASDGCNAVVKWSYSNDRNLNHFEIESSANGIDFTLHSKVDLASAISQGNFSKTFYQSTGKVFYRLKIIDNDGSFIYSKVMRIVTNCNGDKAVKVFPNPVNTFQQLKVNITGYDGNVKGDLYSATGQLVKSYILKNGNNDLSVLNLAQGVYSLKISEKGQQTEVIKVSVLR